MIRILRQVGPFLLIATLSWLVIVNAQNIRDFISLYGYTPPAPVVALADETSMSDFGRKLFYVNKPVIADRSDFSNYCNKRTEKTIVLGCYHSPGNGIYLFDVTDERLIGVEHVTAAHEMLHAGYDRLGDNERRRVDALLNDFYSEHIRDERLQSTIKAYRQSDPSELANEMHSIFATEVRVLTPELEKYYARYFASRKKVVDYAERYQQEFNARRARVQTFDDRLQVLKAEMDVNLAILDKQEPEIIKARNELEELRSSGDIAAYNAAVPGYNAKISEYNRLVTKTRGQIAEYNRLVQERNAVAKEVQELVHSIDSQLAPMQ